MVKDMVVDPDSWAGPAEPRYAFVTVTPEAWSLSVDSGRLPNARPMGWGNAQRWDVRSVDLEKGDALPALLMELGAWLDATFPISSARIDRLIAMSCGVGLRQRWVAGIMLRTGFGCLRRSWSR